MYVVTDAGAILSGVIVAEYGEWIAKASGCLCEIRDEVVRMSQRQFADGGRWVCTDGIEVSQQTSRKGHRALECIGN